MPGANFRPGIGRGANWDAGVRGAGRGARGAGRGSIKFKTQNRCFCCIRGRFRAFKNCDEEGGVGRVPRVGRGGAPQGRVRVGTRLLDMLLAALPLSISAGALAHWKGERTMISARKKTNKIPNLENLHDQRRQAAVIMARSESRPDIYHTLRVFGWTGQKNGSRRSPTASSRCRDDRFPASRRTTGRAAETAALRHISGLLVRWL